MPEFLDIYDENGCKTGRVIERGQPLGPGGFHLGAIVLVMNRQGELLCTKRSPEKRLYPGMWENTGGGALAGETSLSAAVRELWEETGISAKPEELSYLYRVKSIEPDGCGLINDVYALRRDMEAKDLRLQPGETVEARWIPYGEWEALGRAGRILTPAGPHNEDFFQLMRGLAHTRRWPQEDASPALREKIMDLQALAWPEYAGSPWPEPWHVSSFCWMEGDSLLAHAAVVGCAFTHKGHRYQARGVAEVVTHPGHRGKGLALSLLRQANAFIRGSGADVCLFTCQPSLAALYEKAGFSRRPGLELVGGTPEKPFPSGALGLAVMFDPLSQRALARQGDFSGGPVALPLGEGQLW